MQTISARQYRGVCIAALILMALATTPVVRLVSVDPHVAHARTWRYFGCLIPLWALRLYVLVWFPTVVLSLIGMLAFASWARGLLLVTLLAVATLHSVLGLAVYSAYEALISSFLGYALVWLVTVSFWSPIADSFRGKSEALPNLRWSGP